MNITKVNFTTPINVTGLVSAKGDLISTTDGSGLTNLAVGSNDTVLIANSGESTGVKWGVPPGAIQSSFITSSRTFPNVGNEGVSTIGALNATRMTITIWGGGGGTGGSNDVPGAGSASAVVGWPLDSQQLSTLSATTFTVTIGAGGAGTTVSTGNNGSNSTIISQDANNIVSLTGYGGGYSKGDGQSYGGGGGTGGAANGSSGGPSNNIGGAAGPNGGLDNVGGDITGFWWTGWGGGAANAMGYATDGSDFFGRSLGGAVYSTNYGGGAGGFNGDGGDGALVTGGSGAANSGAGGGGGGTTGGSGGSGGCIINWW